MQNLKLQCQLESNSTDKQSTLDLTGYLMKQAPTRNYLFRTMRAVFSRETDGKMINFTQLLLVATEKGTYFGCCRHIFPFFN